jgi:hypothetical protein
MLIQRKNLMTTAFQEETRDAIRDFDFFRGSWRVHNRRLLKRLQNCTEWEAFDAMTPECFAVLDGLGNIDELHTEDGPIGMSLRFFNKQTGQWHIYWVSQRYGVVYPPVVGGFKDGVGVFEGRDTCDGQPVMVRFTWSDITPTSARWQQAFSPDEGQTWEVNWIMDFTRIEDPEWAD